MPPSNTGHVARSVVVTGASTGIGRATALYLAARGWQVFAGVRKPEDGEALAASAGGSGGEEAPAGTRIIPLPLDVTDPEQVEAAVRTVASGSSETGLAGIVNNAGIAVTGPMEFLPIGDLREQFEVNVLAQVAVTQAFLPMIRQSGGRLVFVGSVSGLVSSRMLGAYAASKFAMEAVVDAFRRELHPWRIRVSLVEPGRVVTPIWQKSVAEGFKRLNRMPPQAPELYHDLLEEMRLTAEVASKSGSHPDLVARAVHRALTARRPRTRYFVGTDAHIINILRRVLSDPLFDRLIRLTRR